jgi:hypothetical protein
MTMRQRTDQWTASVRSSFPSCARTLVDSRYQQAIERSLFNTIFGMGRTQGIMLTYEQDMFRIMASYNDGFDMDNTPWSLGPTAGSTEYAFSGRAEVLLSGTWDQFHEFRSAPGEQTGVMIGGGFHWEKGEYGTAFPFETETIGLTADVSAKFGNLNVFAAVAWEEFDTNILGKTDMWGFVLQGGYHFTAQWEVFGRFEWADFDGVKDLSILTGGVNYYFADHNAKLTADIGYSFNELEVLGSGVDNRTGWRGDSDKGQIVVRTQLQLAF